MIHSFWTVRYSSMVRHPKMRPKDGFRDSIFPLKLCAKFGVILHIFAKRVGWFLKILRVILDPQKCELPSLKKRGQRRREGKRGNKENSGVSSILSQTKSIKCM